MPVNSLFQEKYLPQVKALYDQNVTLRPETIRDKVIIAHHRALLAELRVKHVQRSPFERYELSESEHLLFLEKILANNWHNYKLTLCSYTAQPQSEVTLLLCDIAIMIGQITGKKPIHLLMPGVSTESIVDGVPSLDEIDLKTVLRTHIVSDSGNYLYPVTALSALACESDLDSQKIPNPYYDYNVVTVNGENEGYITPADLERLLNHSLETQAILDAKVRYQRLIKPTNLLGQLQLLIKTLRMNSVSGIGKEEHAGSRVYAGIISFNDYYQTLNDEQKCLIPQDLKDEIEFLLALSGSKEQNDEGTQTLQTCLNIRQGELAALTKQYEAILINIGVDEQEQSSLIKKAREDFVLSQNQIQAKYVQGTYHGEDKLAVSRKLVDTLKVAVEVRTRAEMRDFLRLSANEIKSLLQNNESLRFQLIQKLEIFDDLVLFSTQTPIAQLKMVLHFVAHKLPLPCMNKLSFWLGILDLKRFKIVFNVYKNIIMRDSANFKALLKDLSVEKRDIVFAEFEKVIPTLIQTAKDIYPTLKYLSVTQRTKIYEALKHKISSMIANPLEYAFTLELLTFEQRETIYQEMKVRIPDLVDKAEDLAMVLEFSSERQCKEILAALKARLNEVITSCEQINMSMCFLNDENRAALFEAIKDAMPELITTAKDVGYAFEFLNNPQSLVVFEQIKDKLPELIQSPRDVSRILKRLSIEQCHMMLNSLNEILPKLILNTRDILHSMRRLDTEHSRLVLQSLPSIWMQSAATVGEVLKVLDRSNRFIYMEIIKENLPNLIQNAQNVSEICQHLTDEQSACLLGTIIDKIPSIIKSVDDYIEVFKYLDEIDEQKGASLKKALNEKLPSIIHSCKDLGRMLMSVGGERAYCQEFLELVKDKLLVLVKSPLEIAELLIYVEDIERPALLEVIINILPNIFNEKHDDGFACLLNLLDPVQSPELLETILPRAIKSAMSFGQVFKHLNQEQRNELFKAMKDRLTSLIKNADDAGWVFANLEAEQFTIVLDSIKDQLPKVFKTVDEVSRLDLHDEKRALIIAALEKAQASELAANAPTFLPHKRLIEGNEPAKRQKRVGRREMEFLGKNAALEQPKVRKRKRISHS